MRKQKVDHGALGDAMRGQAMCQTIHPDVDRGKAQRLAVILPRQERTITDRLRLMLQHGRQRPLRKFDMRLKMRKGHYLLSCIDHRYSSVDGRVGKDVVSKFRSLWLPFL